LFEKLREETEELQEYLSNFRNRFRVELLEQNKQKSLTICAKNWKAN
jgi:hypothetical protein